MRHPFLSNLLMAALLVAFVLGAVAMTGQWERVVVRPAGALFAAVQATGSYALDAPSDSSSARTDASPSNASEIGDARAALTALDGVSVSGPRRTPEYDRREFGPTWADVDGNGCDTRNDVLRRDLTDLTVERDGCTVLAGTLDDPYTGKQIPFTRGVSTSAAVQIDHVVPLSYAWSNGAWAWDEAKRTRFANDTGNLLAVDGIANTGKSDSGPAEWEPKNRAYRCSYSARFVSVADRYDLTILPADAVMLRHTLEGCR
ncbi:MAG: HNH endonuclease family protein [Curtobacterium sp.]